MREGISGWRTLLVAMEGGNFDDRHECTIENNILKGCMLEFKPKYDGVGEAVFKTMKQNMDFIGQIDALTGTVDRFRDMLDRSVKCALWLRKQGVKPGDVVAVSTHNHLDACIPCIATLFVGAMFNTWDQNMNTVSGSHFLKVSQPKIIFANESAAAVVLKILNTEQYKATLVVFGEHPAAIPFSETLKGHSEAEISSFRYTEVNDPKQPALLVFSSGTTGLPKGVEISHYAFLFAEQVCGPLELRGKTSIWFSSISWISGAILQFQAILHCSTRIVVSDIDADTTWKFVEKYKVEWMFIGTSLLHRLGKSDYTGKYKFPNSIFVLTGGAGLKGEAQSRLKKHFPNFQIRQGYGMSEIGGVCSSQTASSTDGSVGFPITNVQVKVINPDTGKILGPNQPGEFCVIAPTTTTGYYRNKEATEKLFDEEGWLHTGDLGYYTEKGEMFIIERLKEIIKYKGHHVPPGAVEPLLQSHPAVLEAAVIGLPHPTDDELPMAFVSVVPGKQVTEQELVDLVARELMDHYRLRGGVKFVESLPHNASGKISRKELKEMAKAIKTV